MKFSVIYEVDCAGGVPIRNFMPSQRRLFQQTEGDECAERPWLFGKCKHRKLVALLTRDQFDRFVDECGLVAEDYETAGSLGAPGFGFGWAPAMPFCADSEDAYVDAYVTPIPEPVWAGR